MGMNKLILIAGGWTLIYAVLAVLMGVLPGIELSNTPPGAGVDPLSALQAEGRADYVANGCSYCHTQQVRPLKQDKVFGRPSAPGDFTYQTPELLGSERTGPELTNVGERQPSVVWQYIHLYNPRAVVPQSIMPAFDWLFQVVDSAPSGTTPVALPKAYAPTHGVVVPAREAQALIAYLLALKQPPYPDAADSSAAAIDGASSTGGPISTAAPNVGNDAVANGQTLFTATCVARHQAKGEGLPGAFPPLKSAATVNDVDPTHHIHVVLHGLQGTKVGRVVYASQMPPFGTTLKDAEIASIINYERSSWGNHGAPVTAEQVAAERAKGN
jgi:cytochrome c oxidase cbb3-type subunit 2